jgi:hypothetical protein
MSNSEPAAASNPCEWRRRVQTHASTVRPAVSAATPIVPSTGSVQLEASPAPAANSRSDTAG